MANANIGLFLPMDDLEEIKQMEAIINSFPEDFNKQRFLDFLYGVQFATNMSKQREVI